ncbi:MAG: 16S rRNA (uracil(1498)-N(3))-methyltransferase [uncultured Chloroflexi bacterium]|uniref:Ribosomal RNA small subunit methyltransferase E n=1 Tax=uncultured Chloroflexota bacterium TaxID=166587 RepID=A0A6J4JBD0_9CHLR|nr:MAG: 16S rRNA (uracil(1498)-N(3))-methyltransferase [uncultured Chloroflexota bacterium]
MSSVPRFFIEARLSETGQHVPLPPETARQVATVLRLRPGDQVVLFNDGGPQWLAKLADVDRGATTVRLVEQQASRPSPPRGVTLCQALLKGEKMEWVLQKGTELGLAAFQPVLSDRVIARKSETPERWRRILVEAAEQCGRVTIPRLLPPLPLDQVLRTQERTLLCWEDEHALSLLDALRSAPGDPLRIVVGPEGGFAPHEVERARAASTEVVSLGPLILRAETAAIAASTLALLTP